MKKLKSALGLLCLFLLICPMCLSFAEAEDLDWSSSALPSAYRTYVVYAMQDAGYGTSRTYTFSAPASATVLAKRKTGTYAITKDAKLHNGTWDIVRWTVSKSGTPTSETDEWCRSTTSYASGTLVSVLGALKTTSPYYATKID